MVVLDKLTKLTATFHTLSYVVLYCCDYVTVTAPQIVLDAVFPNVGEAVDPNFEFFQIVFNQEVVNSQYFILTWM